MIQIEYKGQVIATNVSIADGFFSRLAGYMFRARPHLPGIMFIPATSIHTCFMHFPIDVIFMDRKYQIIKIYRNLVPWRHTGFHLSSRNTLELPAGKFPSEIKEGDILEVKNV